VVGLVYTALVVAFLALMSWGMGHLIFGTGDLIVFYQTINIVPEAELPWRFAAAFAYGGLSMGVVASLAFFCSTLANQAMGPIITTVAILIGCIIISTIEVGLFRTVQPLLFTTYLKSLPVNSGYPSVSCCVTWSSCSAGPPLCFCAKILPRK
jgi:ABC-2 type transport system permease protein